VSYNKYPCKGKKKRGKKEEKILEVYGLEVELVFKYAIVEARY